MNKKGNDMHWIIEGSESLLPYTLLLKSRTCMESAGFDNKDRDRIASVLSAEDYDSLVGPGLDLVDEELAVFERVRAVVGVGAMAAAKVRLHHECLRMRDKPNPGYVRYSAADIASGSTCVGVVRDEKFGTPFIALGHDPEFTDVLILSWSTEWMAFRMLMKTVLLQFGERVFAESFETHKQAVEFHLGDDFLEVATGSACLS